LASAVIYAIGSQSGNQPRIRRIIEKNAQNFLMGVPVMIDAPTGAIKEWDGATTQAGIAGVSKEPASNLAATGVRQFLSMPGGPAPNQPLGQKIARGGPYNDGRIGFELADEDILFFAQVGPAQVTAANLVGGNFGMTKDGDGHWFVDTNKVAANQVVCQVVKLDQADTVRGVWIVFLPTAQQLML